MTTKGYSDIPTSDHMTLQIRHLVFISEAGHWDHVIMMDLSE